MIPRIRLITTTRDTLCPLDLLEQVRRQTKARSILHVVEGGDHSLGAARRHLRTTGETQEDVDRRVLETIACFVQAPL
jgi:hypothetical protein